MNIIRPEVFKEQHKNALFPPSFDKDVAIYEMTEGFNCYAYAMQFTIPVERGNGYYRPGFLTGKSPKGIYTKDILIQCFLSDCKYLNLNVEETTLYAPLQKFAYKIILWHNDLSFNTFHFTRQNEDGRWSEVSRWGEWPESGMHLNEEFYSDEGFEKKVYYISRK